MNQLANSIPKDVLLRTSYVERQQLNSIQTAQEVSAKLKSSMARRVQFTEAKGEYAQCSYCSSADKTLSGESCVIARGQDDFPRSRCQSDRGTECCLGSRFQSNQGTKLCPGSRQTSRTNQRATVQTPSARVLTRSLSLERMYRSFPPTET